MLQPNGGGVRLTIDGYVNMTCFLLCLRVESNISIGVVQAASPIRYGKGSAGDMEWWAWCMKGFLISCTACRLRRLYPSKASNGAVDYDRIA